MKSENTNVNQDSISHNAELEIIRVENLHKNFGENEILKGVNLSVKQGEVISIVGSSGSGKSTLLRCINLLEYPTKGKIMFEGTDVLGDKSNQNTYRAKVGMVFQHFNLFSNMNVLQNCITAQVMVLKRTKEEASENAIKYLHKVGMAEYVNARPAQLSGGQKQRVAIARALAMNPDALLFDEPTSALDPELIREVLKTIESVAKDGMTMLIVTHEMTFARRISNKIAFMSEGVIEEIDTPDVVFDNPKSIKLKNFLRV
ncbi:MAG: amino acid ABC transporter ATP-binding protein [Bifidobacteriaceae bacterium]|jgi:putative lysine transport system ATP-binding protein|nr:amino acid ABC transporter ATP-binding protein [Bifidobacteriaceae bacterium]